MEAKELTIEKPYIITYTNLIEFDGRKLSFRKKELFDISNVPNHIKRSEQGWWIGRKLLTMSKAKELYKSLDITLDISHFQWYQQEQLNHVFNL
jgi:hypothetical protein